MSITVLPINAPSPGVSSGLASLSARPALRANYTDSITGSTDNPQTDGADGAGTGPGPTGRPGTTIADHSVEVTPSTIPVQQLGPGANGVNSGLSASLPKQNATTITNPEPEIN